MKQTIADSFISGIAYLESVITIGVSVGYELDNEPDPQEERRNKPEHWEIEPVIQAANEVTASLAWDIEKTEYSKIDWQQIDVLTAYYRRFEALYSEYTRRWKDGELDELNEKLIQATIQLRRFEKIRPIDKVLQQQTGPRTIPDELNTPEGRAILEKAIKAGFCDSDYNWMKPYTICLCAYFAKKACKALMLKVKTLSNGEQATSWKPFEILFGYKSGQLRTAEQSWLRDTLNRKRDDFYPDGADKVDALF